jgi:hypothetical protein
MVPPRFVTAPVATASAGRRRLHAAARKRSEFRPWLLPVRLRARPGRAATGTYTPRVSRTETVPQDSAEGRQLLQRRIALYAGVIFCLDTGFYFLVLILALMGGGLRLEPFVGPSELTHLASCLVLGTMWILCARGRRSQTALDWIDAGGLVLVGVFYGLMCALIPPEGSLSQHDMGSFQSLTGVLAMTNTAITRAVLVPSSARRTLWVSIAATVPVVGAVLYVGLYSAPQPFFMVVQFIAFAALPIIIATVASRVIYGLRKLVREATQLGQYTLEEKIGEGGMGVVYRARHAMLRRPTAIKVLPPEKAGEQGVARFEREVQLTSRLVHPNTVSIYDYGRTPEGAFYYAMEFLDGIDLEVLVGTDGPQSPGRVVNILAQVCGALSEAHGIGLIHRDIKPANILTCQHGGVSDVAKVVDFGLVKVLDHGDEVGASLTGAQTITGTPLYLSPEAISDPDRVDARADLYALGAVGYFMLTGRPVFQGSSVVSICGHHLHSTPVPPAERLGRRLPEGLSQVLLQCLAKHPDDRPRDALSLRSALMDCGVAPWTDDEAAAWWRVNRATIEAHRRAGAESVQAHAATMAIDLRERQAGPRGSREEPFPVAAKRRGRTPSVQV